MEPRTGAAGQNDAFHRRTIPIAARKVDDFKFGPTRHCERSEAIHIHARALRTLDCWGGRPLSGICVP